MSSLILIAFPFTLLLTIVLGHFLLPKLRALHLGQTVREDGPKSHFAKNGTPTFGGLIFAPPIFMVGVFLYFYLGENQILSVILMILGFSCIGFIDDYIKVRVDKGGLTVLQKTIGMVVLCLMITLFVLFSNGNPILLLPFVSEPIEVVGWWKLLYGIFIMLYVYFCINAVNLTDGIDGLASSVTIVSMYSVLMVSVFCLGFGNWIAVLALAVAGGCAGFLVFNKYPAQVFMGDVGSLTLGAFAGLLPLLLGVPWIFLFIGFIYVIEGLSVVLQVGYFKYTKKKYQKGKRIFRMSPIHHHFELGGWNENRIVRTFCVIQILASLVGILLLMTR